MTSDLVKSILIIIIFVGLFGTISISMKFADLKVNWHKHRCSPLVMPFAGALGYNTVDNFTHCVGNIQTNMMGNFLEPVYYILGIGTDLVNTILGSMNFVRTFLAEIRNSVKTIVADAYGIMVNIIIQFQKLVIKLKDTMGKLIGTMTTIMYLLEGTHKTGQSILNGPIGQTINVLSGGACFSKNTKIKLKNGKIKKIKDVALGDILENGSNVCGKLQLKGGATNPYYKIWSDTLQEYLYVTGTHHIYKHDNSDKNILDNYVEVKDFEKAKKTGAYDNILYCLITDNHQIPIGEYTFWDWED